MGIYKYRASNSDNEKIEGLREANSKKEIIDFIASSGYYPLLVEEIEEKNKIKLDLFSKVTVADISVFCRRFYTMLNSKVPIPICLEILMQSTVDKSMKNALEKIKNDIDRGESLSVSMKKHDEVFSKMFITLIEAGEFRGKLKSVILKMSTYYEKENNINNKVKSGIIFPMLLSLMFIIAAIVMLIYMVSTFKEVFEQTGAVMPTSVSLLLEFGGAVYHNLIIIILIIGSLGTGFFYYLKTNSGIKLKNKLCLKIPLLNKMKKIMTISKFISALYLLISSGISPIESIELICENTKNLKKKELFKKIKSNFLKEKSLSLSLKESDIFPPMLYSMIKCGEDAGELEEALKNTSEFYEKELERCVENTISLVEPILIVIMGIIIGFIIMSIMLPMYNSYIQTM